MSAGGATRVSARVQMGQATRRKLLHAAIERLAADGDEAGFDAIAADIGLTKGALYHHFGSRRGLIEEVYKEAIRCHAERVVAASTDGTGRERLLALVTATARLYGSGTPFYRLLLRLHVEAGTSRRHLAPTARRVQRRQRAYMTELVAAGQADGTIRRDLDAAAVGQMVNGALQGLLVQQVESAAAQRRAALELAELLDALL